MSVGKEGDRIIFHVRESMGGNTRKGSSVLFIIELIENLKERRQTSVHAPSKGLLVSLLLLPQSLSNTETTFAVFVSLLASERLFRLARTQSLVHGGEDAV
eukprot:scaffold52869_cov24-Tisochrysis_lutea.AAC.2